VGNKPLVGLPGHPVSALVCFDQFVAPLLRRLEGEDVSAPYLKPVVWAVLSRNLPSQEGRTDFVRVRLERNGEEIRAMPVLSKSGMISGMVRSDGCIRISANCEGLYKGDRVPVELFSNSVEDSLETEHLS
jgi:molybdopterin molybdotransferase